MSRKPIPTKFSLLTTAIRDSIAASEKIDRHSIEDDIRARRHEADAARRWAMDRDQIIEECDRRGITEGEWCRAELGCHIATMRRRLQLWEHWNIYEAKRRAEPTDTGQWGLKYALSLIPSRDRLIRNEHALKTHSLR